MALLRPPLSLLLRAADRPSETACNTAPAGRPLQRELSETKEQSACDERAACEDCQWHDMRKRELRR